MQEGWYCRTLANEQSAASQNQIENEENDLNDVDSGTDDSQDGEPRNCNSEEDYKAQYRYLKGKLKLLIYENEFFQDALRTSQRKLLKVSKDRSFLLDRLLQYEKPEGSTSESEETESSEDEVKEVKKRKNESGGGSMRGRKRKINQIVKTQNVDVSKTQIPPKPEGHMTAEEVERHLQSRQSIMEMVPERAPATVPNEMFSNEPSLDSESNDQVIETSPSNVGDEFLSIEYNN